MLKLWNTKISVSQYGMSVVKTKSDHCGGITSQTQMAPEAAAELNKMVSTYVYFSNCHKGNFHINSSVHPLTHKQLSIGRFSSWQFRYGCILGTYCRISHINVGSIFGIVIRNLIVFRSNKKIKKLKQKYPWTQKF